MVVFFMYLCELLSKLQSILSVKLHISLRNYEGLLIYVILHIYMPYLWQTNLKVCQFFHNCVDVHTSGSSFGAQF